MADPLTQVANEFAPVGGANMFDPTVGRDVIARYGMAGMRNADTERNLRLSGLARNERLGSMREQEEIAAAPIRERKRDLEANRLDLEEKDVRDRRDLMMVEGDVARELWLLDPESPTYPQDYRERLAMLPPGAAESAMIKPALEYHELRLKDRLMRDRYAEQEGLRRERAVMQADQRLHQMAGGKGVDAENREAIYRKNLREDGTLDEVGYGMDLAAAAFHSERTAEMQDFKTKEGVRQDNAIERIRAYRDPAKRSRAIEDFKKQTDKKVETMRNAFPPQLDALRIGYAASQLGDKATGTKADIAALLERDNITLKDLDEELDPLAVEDAKALDSDIAFSEERFALNYESMEDYVDLVPGLNESEKEARRDKWRAANEAWDTSDEAVDAPRVDMLGFESEAEVAAPEAAAPAAPAAPAAAPAATGAFKETKTINGVTYGFDGQGWLPVTEGSVKKKVSDTEPATTGSKAPTDARRTGPPEPPPSTGAPDQVGYQRLGGNPEPRLKAPDPGGQVARPVPPAPAQRPPSAPGVPPEIAVRATPVVPPTIEVEPEDLEAVTYVPRTPEDVKFAKEVRERDNISVLPPAPMARADVDAPKPTREQTTERISVEAPDLPQGFVTDVSDFGEGSRYDWNPDAPKGRATADKDASRYSSWVTEKKDNQGKPYVVGDKKAGKMYLFDAEGDLIAEAPALYGRAIGDTIPDDRRGVSKRELQMTPAGRFDPTIVETDKEFYAPAWVDFAYPGPNWSIAIHGPYTKYPDERRLERLASATPDDNRISGGCVNVPMEFLTESLLPAFSNGGVVYVMPEDEKAREVPPEFK